MITHLCLSNFPKCNWNYKKLWTRSINAIILTYVVFSDLYHFFNAIASQKTTYTTGSGFIGTADLGIDGNTDPNFYHGSCFITALNTEFPWWMVDLSVNFRVESVIMWNRLDSGCGIPCCKWNNGCWIFVLRSLCKRNFGDNMNLKVLSLLGIYPFLFF